MKRVLLITIQSVLINSICFSNVGFLKSHKQNGIYDESLESDFIGVVEILNFSYSIFNCKTIDVVKGEKMENIKIRRPGNALNFDPSERMRMYEIGQKSLIFLTKKGDDYFVNIDLPYINDSIKCYPFGISHGSFTKEYRKNGENFFRKENIKTYSYLNLKEAILFFKAKNKKIIRILKKESSIKNIRKKIKEGRSFRTDTGPEIIYKKRKLLKIRRENLAYKRLLDELTENMITENRYWY